MQPRLHGHVRDAGFREIVESLYDGIERGLLQVEENSDAAISLYDIDQPRGGQMTHGGRPAQRVALDSEGRQHGLIAHWLQ